MFQLLSIVLSLSPVQPQKEYGFASSASSHEVAVDSSKVNSLSPLSNVEQTDFSDSPEGRKKVTIVKEQSIASTKCQSFRMILMVT